MEAFRAIFAVLDDPRDHNTCHELHEVLFLAFAAMLCGAQNCVEIAEFGRAKLPLLRSFLTLKHGVPSHDTISRLFRLLDPKAFASCFARFMEAFHAQLVQERRGQRVVAIDGKSLRRAYDKGRSHMPAMMVSAWGVETRLTLAHTIAPGGNEVEGALKLLEMISLKGCIVTGDSLYCNRKMAGRLRELKADYVLALKGNQFDLTREAKALLDAAAEASGTPCAESSESGHGRIERRRAIVVPAKALGEKRKFPGLVAVARVEDWREEGGKTVHHTRMFALSKVFPPARVLQIVRGHWSIENQCHWLLDVVFHEDLARNRKDHGPENLSILRRMTMNVLRVIPTKASIAVKRKQAAWSDDAFFTAMTYLR
jgi:predicted transposase YbfD/YdcC